MSLLRVLWSFLHPPKIETPPQDIYPPDGSVHFITYPPQGRDKLLTDFKIYEFGANLCQEEEDFIPHMIEVMRRLCNGKFVLTDIESTPEKFEKRKYLRDERFTVRCRRFLEKAHPELSAYSENEKRLAVLTDGFCADILFAYEELETLDHCWFNFYLFSEKAVPTSAKQAWNMVCGNKFSARLSINDSPVALEMTLDPRTVDIAAVRSIVEDVCREHGVLLCDPAEGEKAGE